MEELAAQPFFVLLQFLREYEKTEQAFFPLIWTEVLRHLAKVDEY